MAVRDLEEEGSGMLRAALAVAERHLRTSSGPEREGELIRVALHVRGADGYRALVMVDSPGSRVERGPGELSVSTSAWEMVRRLDQAVVVNVTLGEVRALGQAGDPAQRLPGIRMTPESQELFLGHGTTHLLALPVRDEGRPQGMVSLELGCPGGIAAPIQAWNRAAPEIQALLDRDFPGLLRAGGAEPPEINDPGLPVVGRTMAPVVRLLRTAARFDDTLLLTGASGVGKSRLARWIHDRSRRASGPFEHVHLQNYPETLIEGELFGWVRGAHDGAQSSRDGHIARAEGGTLFLDEIDKLSLGAQRKLLHLLESRAWRPLGSSGREHTADLRFIVGTNTQLETEVEQGRFLADLHWRIRTMPVQIPSLDERQDEIRGWAEHFLRRKHKLETGREDARLSESALALLSERSWPGNLRQLEQAIVRAWLICADVEGQGTLYVDSTSLRAALAFDERAGQPALDSALRVAAAAFRRELLRRRAEGSRPLTLDDADAFRGYVLSELEAQLGLDEAFIALGMEKRVSGRNHHATYKRELDRIKALWGEG
jgi:hypothetical protein